MPGKTLAAGKNWSVTRLHKKNNNNLSIRNNFYIKLILISISNYFRLIAKQVAQIVRLVNVCVSQPKDSYLPVKLTFFPQAKRKSPPRFT